MLVLILVLLLVAVASIWWLADGATRAEPDDPPSRPSAVPLDASAGFGCLGMLVPRAVMRTPPTGRPFANRPYAVPPPVPTASDPVSDERCRVEASLAADLLRGELDAAAYQAAMADLARADIDRVVRPFQ